MGICVGDDCCGNSADYGTDTQYAKTFTSHKGEIKQPHDDYKAYKTIRRC